MLPNDYTLVACGAPFAGSGCDALEELQRELSSTRFENWERWNFVRISTARIEIDLEINYS